MRIKINYSSFTNRMPGFYRSLDGYDIHPFLSDAIFMYNKVKFQGNEHAYMDFLTVEKHEN